MIAKLNEIWPRVGGFLALVITIIVAYVWLTIPDVSVLPLIYWLNLVVLMLHEFEEYVLPGGFKNFMNTKTVFSMENPVEDGPISDLTVFIINIGIWVIFIAAALLADIIPWLGLGMVIFNVINIIGHLLVFQVKSRGYNPGLITAILMIPFLIFAFVAISAENILSTADYVLAFVIGFISAASLPIAGANIRRKYLASATQ